jgi:SNF2 family DNA or RNA helicase
MWINIKDETIAITFDYSPSIVKAIRTIPGRVFNPALKRWEVPAENVLECLETLQPFLFNIHLDVKHRAELLKKEIEESEELKINPSVPYSGALPLYDFQKIGAAFLKARSASFLADVPGLGKTIQTIAALEDEKRVLILCPASLKFYWLQEIKKWSDENTLVIDGDKRKRVCAWKTEGVKYYVANYELLPHDFDEMPKEWDAIVADEATRVSNSTAKTTKLLKQLRTKKKIALTGTPISNSPNDLYSIIDWLSPRFLGTYNQFLSRYCIVDARYPSMILGYQNLSELKYRVSRFILRRTKEEVFTQFPPKTINDIVFDLSEEERKLYDDIRNLIWEELESLTINKGTLQQVLVKMLRLKQATDHPALISDLQKSSKLEALRGLIKEIIENDDKVIVFSQFAEMAKRIHDDMPQSLLIYGDVPAEKRQQIVNLFQNEPFYKVLVMTEAGAYGLNLQAASYVIHYDSPWSVAKLMQREDRAHRIGQTKPVTVYNLIARQTIDEYVLKKLHKKQKLAVELLQDVERLEAQGIDEEDIKSILRI